MAHFMPVAPIQVLEQLYDHDPAVFGNYHLLLAHHTVQYADRFHALFSRIAADGLLTPTIIMDNSVVEQGGSVDIGVMKNAVAACLPDTNEVISVLPDVMGDGLETRKATEAAYERWVAEIPGPPNFMAVCQGNDMPDFEQSVQFFADRDYFPDVNYLGVPRYLVYLIHTRTWAMDFIGPYVEDYKTNHMIHLLGYSDLTLDDLEVSNYPTAFSIDSAVPLRTEGSFRFGDRTMPRPKDWFDTASIGGNMIANLSYARQMHSSGGHDPEV